MIVITCRKRIVQAKASESESEDSEDESSASLVSESESLEDLGDGEEEESADEAYVDALGSYDDADFEHYQQVFIPNPHRNTSFFCIL